MLIGISIMFIVFNTPNDVYFLGYAYGAFSQKTPEQQAVKFLFYAVTQIIYCTNNSINFFMYFASGQKFRIAFLNTFFCVQPKKPGKPKPSSGKAITIVQNTSVAAPPENARIY